MTVWGLALLMTTASPDAARVEPVPDGLTWRREDAAKVCAEEARFLAELADVAGAPLKWGGRRVIIHLTGRPGAWSALVRVDGEPVQERRLRSAAFGCDGLVSAAAVAVAFLLESEVATPDSAERDATRAPEVWSDEVPARDVSSNTAPERDAAPERHPVRKDASRSDVRQVAGARGVSDEDARPNPQPNSAPRDGQGAFHLEAGLAWSAGLLPRGAPGLVGRYAWAWDPAWQGVLRGIWVAPTEVRSERADVDFELRAGGVSVARRLFGVGDWALWAAAGADAGQLLTRVSRPQAFGSGHLFWSALTADVRLQWQTWGNLYTALELSGSAPLGVRVFGIREGPEIASLSVVGGVGSLRFGWTIE